MAKLPEYMTRDEKVECLNCGWTGTTDNFEELDTCPSCFCDGYLCIDEEEYQDEEE